MTRQKILIVDDRADNLLALAQTLAELDVELVQANSGNAALAATLSHDFALAILDVQMPGMDGFELANLLRGEPRTAHLPVIFLSAIFHDEGHLFRGYASGAVDYLVKPFDPFLLLCKVRILLDLDRQRGELAESKRLLDETAQLAHVGGWELDLRDNHLLWSAETRRIHEVTDDFCPTLEDGINFYPPEARPLLREALAKAAADGEPFDLELPFDTARGARLWVRAIGHPQRVNGVPVAINGVFQDVTRRRTAEDELRAHRDQLRQLVAKRTRELEEERARLIEAQEVAHLGSWEWDVAGNHIVGSAEFYRLCHATPEQLRTLSDFIALVHPGERKRVRRTLPETIRRGSPYQNDVRLLLPDGVERTLFLRGRFMRDEDGRVTRMVGTCLDVSERQATAEALRASEALLNETGRIAGIGGWSINLASRKLTWTRTLYELHEVGDDFVPTVENAIAFYTPESRPAITAAVTRAIENGEPFDLELDLITARGRELRVQAIGRAQLGSDGRARIISGTFQDITARKTVEEALQQALYAWQTTFDAVEDSICLLDAEHRIIQFNRASERFVGADGQLGCGGLCYEAIHGTNIPHPDCPYERAKLSGKREICELNQGAKWFEVTVDPIFTAAGAFSGAVHLLRDITERHFMQERLHEAQMQIIQQEKLATVGQLAAGVSHEINNPLGIISQAAQTIERRLSPDLPANVAAAGALGLELKTILAYLDERKILEMLAAIRDSVGRTSKIVDSLLQFSRKSREGKRACNLSELVEQALTLAATDYDLTRKFDFRAIEIVRDFAPDLPPVQVVAVEIEQVVLNLVKNAAQALFTREKRGTPRIVLRLRRDVDRALLEVEDNGPGMSEEVQRRIFEPFFTTKEPGVGTGLGLSVSHMIVTQNHDGTLEVFSQPGQGARFVMGVPLAPPPATTGGNG